MNFLNSLVLSLMIAAVALPAVAADKAEKKEAAAKGAVATEESGLAKAADEKEAE